MIFPKFTFHVAPNLSPTRLAQKALPHQPQAVCATHSLGLAHNFPSQATRATPSLHPLSPQGPARVAPRRETFTVPQTLRPTTLVFPSTETSLHNRIFHVMWAFVETLPPYQEGPARASSSMGRQALTWHWPSQASLLAETPREVCLAKNGLFFLSARP